ncbi:hypothetical protein SK128_009913, partial [Halocaridina rubra]
NITVVSIDTLMRLSQSTFQIRSSDTSLSKNASALKPRRGSYGRVEQQPVARQIRSNSTMGVSALASAGAVTYSIIFTKQQEVQN